MKMPVRIGNAAYEQLQIDIFGEVADAMFQARKAGMPRSERGEALRPIVLERVLILLFPDWDITICFY
jgi:hypothetical protein